VGPPTPKPRIARLFSVRKKNSFTSPTVPKRKFITVPVQRYALGAGKDASNKSSGRSLANAVSGQLLRAHIADLHIMRFQSPTLAEWMIGLSIGRVCRTQNV